MLRRVQGRTRTMLVVAGFSTAGLLTVALFLLGVTGVWNAPVAVGAGAVFVFVGLGAYLWLTRMGDGEADIDPDAQP